MMIIKTKTAIIAITTARPDKRYKQYNTKITARTIDVTTIIIDADCNHCSVIDHNKLCKTIRNEPNYTQKQHIPHKKTS